MQTRTRGRFALVLLFSLLIGLSFGASTRRNGIGAAIVGGIVDTNKAIIGGFTETIGAVVDTAKESNNATEKEDKRASRSAYGWDDSSYTANKVNDNLFPQNLPTDDGNGMLTEMNGGGYGGAETPQGDEQFLDVNVPYNTAETDVDVEGSGNLYEPVVVVNEEKSTFGEESSSSSAYGQEAELLPPSNANKLTYGSEMEGTVKEEKLPASGNKAVKFVTIYAVRRRPQGVSQSVSEGRLGDSRRTKKTARNGRNRKSGSLNADAAVEQQRSRRDHGWDDWDDRRDWSREWDDSWEDLDDWHDDIDDSWGDLDDVLDDRRRRIVFNEIMSRRRSRRDDDEKVEKRVRPSKQSTPKKVSKRDEDDRDDITSRPNQLTAKGRSRRGDDDWDDRLDDDNSGERQRVRVPTNPLSQEQRSRRDDWDDSMNDDCDDADDMFDPECRVRLNRPAQSQRNPVVVFPRGDDVPTNPLSQRDLPRRDDDWDDSMDDDCDDADDMLDPECSRVRLNRQVQPKANLVVVSPRGDDVPTNPLSQRDLPRRDNDRDDWMDDDCDDAECRRRFNQRPASPLPPVGNPRPVPPQPPRVTPRPPVQPQPPMFDPRPPVQPRPPMFDPRPPVQPRPPMFDPRPPVQPRPPMRDPRSPVQPQPPMRDPNPPFVPPRPPIGDPRPVQPQPPMWGPGPVLPREGRAPTMTIREETRPVSPREGNVSATLMKDQRPVSPKEEQVSLAPAGSHQPVESNNNQGYPRRARRSVSEAVVGGVTETSKAVANGTENVVDAATGNKKDKAKSKETKGTKKASKIGGAVVDGIADTTNSIATGVENTVDEAKKEVKTTTTTTTTSRPKETSSSSNSTCKSQNICYGDSDCNGGKCIGAFVGTCNCNVCFNFITCTSDEGCGGLKGACDMNTKRCNCQEAHRKLGYPNYFDALTKFCNHQSCDGSSNSCNGLPCTSGRCFC